MLEYRIIKTNNSALKNLGADNWQMCGINNEFMYFSREIKKQIFKKAEQTKEYLEFKEKYPKKSGITDPKVINKVNLIVKEGNYTKLMEGLDKYIKMIKVNNTTKPFILNPLTFLNGERYNDEFDIIEHKLGASDTWMNKHFIGLNPEQIDQVLKMKKEWKPADGKAQFTEGKLLNMIAKVKGIEV